MGNTHEILYRAATPPEDPRVKWRRFQPGRTLLDQGTVFVPGARPLACDVVLDRDVAMQLPDGTTIYMDIFRPVTEEALPALLVWSPYGKQGGFQEFDVFPGRAGVPREATSGLEKFEGPDPAFWCANGYAVVNIDPRGSFASEGDIGWWGSQEVQDGHDVIEWLAAQPWCSGAVGMTGNSYLSVIQWKIAATQPPHLAAIAPWDGFVDVYRDWVVQGGIPRTGLAETLTQTNAGRGRIEDLPAMVRKHPLMNDYWRSKITEVERVAVPAYVATGWTNWIHLRGTLDAFTRLDPSKSWLRVHNTFEWPDSYAYERDLLRFFDYALKKEDNGWEETPRVRLAVLDPGGADEIDRAEEEYPLTRAVETPLYLDAATGGLRATPVTAESHIDYDGAEGTAVFDYVADRDFEIVGPMKLRLWLEVETGDDADVFVYVRKTDAEGAPLLNENWPGTGFMSDGAHGRLRASHRELDDETSTALAPVHRHERRAPLRPGKPVAMDIAIWPHGMRWHRGERLQMVVSGRDFMPDFPGLEPDEPTSNTGSHRIRTGGAYDSHLLVLITG
jgi:predicted acyl esterase